MCTKFASLLAILLDKLFKIYFYKKAIDNFCLKVAFNMQRDFKYGAEGYKDTYLKSTYAAIYNL